MSNPLTILPDSITIQPDIAALDVAIMQYLQAIPLEKLLVYDIDNITADALEVLAAQFDVLGYKGLRMAITEQDKRNLIKKAIELHKYKGTKWALKEAMRSIGFDNTEITTGVAGPIPIWANFKVTLDNVQVGITDDSIANLHRMIEEYKSQRDNLVEIEMVIVVDETIAFDINETISVEFNINADDTIVFNNSLLYDGTGDYDGVYDHSGDSDVIEII